MERLTEMNENKTAYVYPQCFEKCGGVGYSRKCDRCDLLDRVCDKLGEYEDLEEQGKLLKLPCAVGDMVYAFNMAKVIELKVIKISWFTMDGKNVINVECLNTDCDCFRNFVKDEFGKHVFLTKESAEAALKEMSE